MTATFDALTTRTNTQSLLQQLRLAHLPKNVCCLETLFSSGGSPRRECPSPIRTAEQRAGRRCSKIETSPQHVEPGARRGSGYLQTHLSQNDGRRHQSDSRSHNRKEARRLTAGMRRPASARRCFYIMKKRKTEND